MQDFLRFKNGPFLPLLFVTSFFELPCTSVESYARLPCKNKHFAFFSLYGDQTTRITYDTRYRYHVPGIYSKQQFAAGTPIVLLTPLESSHGHHFPTRAASARAARGDVVSIPSERRRHPDAGHARRVESIVSAL